MLTKKTPDTIKGNLTIKAQGVENTLLLTYHNHSPEEYEAFVQNPENLKVPDSIITDGDTVPRMFSSKSVWPSPPARRPLTLAATVSDSQSPMSKPSEAYPASSIPDSILRMRSPVGRLETMLTRPPGLLPP